MTTNSQSLLIKQTRSALFFFPVGWGRGQNPRSSKRAWPFLVFRSSSAFDERRTHQPIKGRKEKTLICIIGNDKKQAVLLDRTDEGIDIRCFQWHEEYPERHLRLILTESFRATDEFDIPKGLIKAGIEDEEMHEKVVEIFASQMAALSVASWSKRAEWREEI